MLDYETKLQNFISEGFRSINFWKEGLEFSLRDIYPISILFYSKLFYWEVLRGLLRFGGGDGLYDTSSFYN